MWNFWETGGGATAASVGRAFRGFIVYCGDFDKLNHHNKQQLRCPYNP